jgi:hypothetical protein
VKHLGKEVFRMKRKNLRLYFLLFTRISVAATTIKTTTETPSVNIGNSGTEGVGVEPKMLVSIMLYE